MNRIIFKPNFIEIDELSNKLIANIDMLGRRDELGSVNQINVN